MSETIGESEVASLSAAAEAAQPMLSTADNNGAARATAIVKARESVITPTSLVAYNSQGRLLIAGPADAARNAAQRFAGTEISVSLLITDGQSAGTADAVGKDDQADADYQVIRAPLAAVRGYLGAFEVDVHSADGARPLAPSILTANRLYDLVLDLGAEAAMSAQVPAPGYFATVGDAQRLEAAIEAIPDLHGEFEKPRYFNYNPDICAHGERGQRGCNRCLLACPTEAIVSIGERIEVDAHLCQGGGTCATACPTGAITYAFPKSEELINRLRTLLGSYRAEGGQHSMVLLHDGEAGHEWLLREAAALPGHVLPFAVEEIGSVGLEAWLSMLAFGATRVVILATAQTPGRVREEVSSQLQIVDAIVAALGHDEGRVILVDEAPLTTLAAVFDPAAATLAKPMVKEPAVFAGIADKRGALRLAIDYLYAQAEAPVVEAPMPAHAPFGQITVDPTTCTLCMACASVCPAGAVITPGDSPRLDFIEQNCVQCGLCERVCPESSISTQPRLLFDAQQRAARRVLNEDQPFPCTSCGKVFGSTRTIEKMVEKLAGHWMFQQKPEQMARLRMCEDCRVKDMFRDGGGLLDVDPGARH